jgi:sugar phosphate isomerase/epimerase
MITLSAFADEISPDPIEQIDVLSRHGIRNIEFRAIHGTNVLDLSPSQHEEFRGLLQQRGFGLSAIGSPIGKIRITDPFESHLDRFSIAMDLAEFYATPRIRIFSFYIPEGESPEKHRDEVLVRMRELADRASKRGITLLLENEKGIYGDIASRVHDILSEVDSPSLAHAFDPANYVECSQPVEAAWSRLRPWIKHFHVKDYSAKSEVNVPAGEGDGLIPQLLKDAASWGYNGFCTLEPHLVVAEKSYGFTGPERFGDAANALKAILDRESIPFN